MGELSLPEISLPEPCPPREMLLSYARGGRDPNIAGHISLCDACAWIVAEAMEADPVLRDAEVIDITPRPTGWRRLLLFLRKFF